MKALVSIRRTLATLAAAVALGAAVNVQAASEGAALDSFPVDKLTDLPALQDGARTFVNYCLNCHSASMMRYNRLRDLGLSEAQISGNLLFSGGKVGDLMQVAMRPNDAKEWFGALPPDLSVIARARSSAEGSGSDWLFTYLRSYYRDNTRATGWNNAVFPNVGMPHVLWEWQGSRGASIEEIKAVKDEKTGESHGFARTLITFDNAGNRLEKTEKIESGHPHESTRLTLTPAVGGSMSQAAYDEKVANLVGYLTYMADPSAKSRLRMGVWVLMFLGLLIFLTWWLNREYWKDIK
jgi:ubiquinol-cytochrome c reductase cytochrome c1 subunit